ncbi:hypothetical protein APHAL10511_004303 [Amanita phalloides]|nr:hypothetical protein APHAL10511_004303 [Amanita phalloides]
MHVDCKRCGSRIKLSSKSPYDTFHWRTHRTRCLKKRDGTKKVRKTKNASLSPRDSLLSPPNEPQKRCEKISEPESQILVCKGSRDLEVIKDDSHSANNLNLLTSVANAVLKRSGYLSHPRKEFAKSSPRQWRWSQRNSPEGRDSDLGWRGFQEGMDELRMRQEAIESLALLSRSG